MLRRGEGYYYGNASALCVARRLISVVAHWLPTRTVTRTFWPSVVRSGTLLPRVPNMTSPVRFTRNLPFRSPPAKSWLVSLKRYTRRRGCCQFGAATVRQKTWPSASEIWIDVSSCIGSNRAGANCAYRAFTPTPPPRPPFTTRLFL